MEAFREPVVGVNRQRKGSELALEYSHRTCIASRLGRVLPVTEAGYAPLGKYLQSAHN